MNVSGFATDPRYWQQMYRKHGLHFLSVFTGGRCGCHGATSNDAATNGSEAGVVDCAFDTAQIDRLNKGCHEPNLHLILARLMLFRYQPSFV